MKQDEIKFNSEVQSIVSDAALIASKIDGLSIEDKIYAINSIKKIIHEKSPFKDEPVDCVLWVKCDSVTANDYNPNSVAPPEMKLLEHSIAEDGYTQPIVAWAKGDEEFEVVDGFHRNRVGKESKNVKKRIHGFLPVTIINGGRIDRNDRIASTIRHNRARGKHKIEAMSDIVLELKRRNWTDERISKELGMDQDEILRLCQITGLADMFADKDFSKSWDVEGSISEEDFKELSDDVSQYGEEKEEFRTVNTGDEKRIFHTYEKWECYKAGFYNTHFEGMTKEQCHEAYRAFLSDTVRFEAALERVINEWKHSCEHYLTNSCMNRIAWLGQAAMCYATGIPSEFRSGFFLLTPEQQDIANNIALKYLNKWLENNGRETVDMDTAYGGDRQSQIY